MSFRVLFDEVASFPCNAVFCFDVRVVFRVVPCFRVGLTLRAIPCYRDCNPFRAVPCFFDILFAFPPVSCLHSTNKRVTWHP